MSLIDKLGTLADQVSDDVILTAGGKRLTGWTSVEVTRSLQQMPNTFRFEATEGSTLLRDASGLREGAPCTVAIGRDKVITGYVDTIISSYGRGTHSVLVQGRGKCQDLVDCSAEWKGCQVSGSNALEIAQKLAAPYGISAKAIGDPGPVVPQFNINVTDTPADVLELVTRHAGLLYYEDAEGDLVLAEAAAEDAGSGFQEGRNVQAATVVRSIAPRYAEYVCSLLSVDTSGLFEAQDGLFYFTSNDPYVARHRRLVSVAEGVMGGLDLAKKRALWDAARRAGRGRSVSVTADSWRDASRKLWSPNTLAPIKLPALRLTGAAYCIAEVTYRLDLEGGRRADVLLMPREAFLPAPLQLQPIIPGLTPILPGA